jgi:hypothetical protein
MGSVESVKDVFVEGADLFLSCDSALIEVLGRQFFRTDLTEADGLHRGYGATVLLRKFL